MKEATITLSLFCKWNFLANAASFLEADKSLDLTYDEGICFKAAIEHGNTDLLQLLLDYYRDNALNCGNNTDQYQIAFMKLKSILTEAATRLDPDLPSYQAIMGCLAPYVPFDQSDTNSIISDLDDSTISMTLADMQLSVGGYPDLIPECDTDWPIELVPAPQSSASTAVALDIEPLGVSHTNPLGSSNPCD
jgi:hypothetical protein